MSDTTSKSDAVISTELTEEMKENGYSGFLCLFEDNKVDVYISPASKDVPVEGPRAKVIEFALNYFSKKYPRRKIKQWQVSIHFAEKDGVPHIYDTIGGF